MEDIVERNVLKAREVTKLNKQKMIKKFVKTRRAQSVRAQERHELNIMEKRRNAQIREINYYLKFIRKVYMEEKNKVLVEKNLRDGSWQIVLSLYLGLSTIRERFVKLKMKKMKETRENRLKTKSFSILKKSLIGKRDFNLDEKLVYQAGTILATFCEYINKDKIRKICKEKIGRLLFKKISTKYNRKKSCIDYHDKGKPEFDLHSLQNEEENDQAHGSGQIREETIEIDCAERSSHVP
jgi:hypothetical protein